MRRHAIFHTMARVLILGGTRNLGHVTAVALLNAGHTVTVLNRGLTRDELPGDVERLHAAREDVSGVSQLVKDRSWDAVVDTTSYAGSDAATVHAIFAERCARMVFISTGQVYLVRGNVRAPFKESDYDGPLIPAPEVGTDDHLNWLYGIEKRSAEDQYRKAARSSSVVILRFPMIASERDHYGRIQGYIARIEDGGPILVPDDAHLPIRHVYVEDAAEVITGLCADTKVGFGEYNISFGQSISLPEFLQLLGSELGEQVEVVPVARKELNSRGLLPACSPYSGTWMSELDNGASVRDLSIRYRGPADYVPPILEDYHARWEKKGIAPPGYEQRPRELDLARLAGKSGANFLD